MKKGTAVTVGALLAVVSTGFSQTINPLQPASGIPPVPTYQGNTTLQPLSPSTGRPSNAGYQTLSSEITPIEPSLDPTAQDAEVLTDDTSTTGGETAADGKTVAEAAPRTWRLRPIFGAGVVYDDNIYISETNRVSDVIFTLTAGLAFELGDYRNLQENYLLAEYIATGFLYADNTQQNAVDQSAALIGQYRISKLAIQLNSRYQYLNGAEREVGNFATRHLFRNSLRFAYDYSDKTLLDLEFTQSANVYEEYLDTYNYAVKAGAEYEITPKIWLGAEGVAGFTATDGSPLQTYQQLRLRARYAATGKLTFKSSAGVEIRELQDGVRVSPVFSLGSEYRPFTNTLIALVGYGDVQSSASTNGQNYLATGLELSVRQLVFQSITVGMAVGYENDTYFSAEDGDGSGRVDNYLYLRPSLSYAFLKWFNAGVFYEFRRNDSNSEGNSFYNNRVGVELAAKF